MTSKERNSKNGPDKAKDDEAAIADLIKMYTQVVNEVEGNAEDKGAPQETGSKEDSASVNTDPSSNTEK